MRPQLLYGIVMATAGTATMARISGLRVLALPLLILAMIQAVWIAARWAPRHHNRFLSGRHRPRANDSPGTHTGLHTVPLGLAMITSGLAHLSGSGSPPGLMWLTLACFGLTWLLTMTCLAGFLRALIGQRWPWATLDGTWFLVPAALLGGAVAAENMARLPMPWGTAALHAVAVFGAVTGWLGYWLVAGAAAVRVGRLGLGNGPRAPWWISMGCAGLAAAALGELLHGGLPTSGTLAAILTVAMATVMLCALILLIPIVIGSVAFLVRALPLHDAAAWPPTFSTVVFALGCLRTGEAVQSTLLQGLGLAACFAAIALWSVTAAWNTIVWLAKRIRAVAE